MNLKDQIQQIKEFIVNFSIDINTDDGLALEIESSINQAHASDSLSGILAIGIPYMGMLLPIIIVLAIFGGLIVLSQGSAVAPFIYTIF